MTQKILHANGGFTDNSSGATVVGSTPLADSDDATYIESAENQFGYTVGLEALTGYESGDAIALHVRLSITGDGTPVDANGQFFIATDAAGVDEIGGFSDGSVSGFGFAVPIVDGTIQDIVVPLSMGAWSPSTEADVVAALEAGASLDVNAIINSNWVTPPVATVYEAWVQVGEDSGISTPCDTTVDVDLSTAHQLSDDSGPLGQVVDGEIVSTGSNDPCFWLDFEVDPVKAYQIGVTYDSSSAYDSGGRLSTLYLLTPGSEDADFAAFLGGSTTALVGQASSGDVQTITVGPGRTPITGLPSWDDPSVGVSAGRLRLMFETSGTGAVSAITIRKVCTTFAPPLRLTNRDDMFASARGLTGSSSRQASNRLTGYL